MVSIPSDAIEQTLVYKETEQKSIELIWRAPTNRIYEKAPVFLVIPGGGWRVESKTDMLTLVPGASETLRAAAARWDDAEDYAHCMLPHESTDAVTEGFRRAIRTVEAGDASAAADINLLRVRIQGLADGERITLGNLF